jgi:hypothetical protein
LLVASAYKLEMMSCHHKTVVSLENTNHIIERHKQYWKQCEHNNKLCDEMLVPLTKKHIICEHVRMISHYWSRVIRTIGNNIQKVQKIYYQYSSTQMNRAKFYVSENVIDIWVCNLNTRTRYPKTQKDVERIYEFVDFLIEHIFPLCVLKKEHVHKLQLYLRIHMDLSVSYFMYATNFQTGSKLRLMTYCKQ